MTNLTYKQNGDYLIPDLPLEQPEMMPLGKYARMRRTYLKEHQPVLFNSLLLKGQLYPHLQEIDRTANERLNRLMTELMQAQGVNEHLKASDPMRWTGLMNNLKAQAEEFLLTELVYS